MLLRLTKLNIAIYFVSLRSVESGLECCELALTGSPQELDEAHRKFADTQREVAVLGYEMYRFLTNAA